jgi:hypothetical protein
MSDARLIGFYNKFFSSVADHDLWGGVLAKGLGLYPMAW